MICLNLTASGTEQNLIKDYLEQNASDTLAEKINNGVIIEKDNKKLLNVKTLDGFMAYAAAEAKKLAEQGAKYACIESKTVFGWAVHYFEEESIEEKLYLEDGTEYKYTPKYTPRKIEHKKTEPKAKKNLLENSQQSMFDLFAFDEAADEKTKEPPAREYVDEITNQPGSESDIEDDENKTEEVLPKESEISPLYMTFCKCQKEFGQNAIILMRIGDFYEVFGEWAKRISEDLNLTLVGRDLGLAERTPMIGIPYHKLDIYLPKMTSIAPVAVYQKDTPAQFYPMTPIINYKNVDKETGEVFEVELNAEIEECLRILRSILKDELEVSL